MILLLSVLVRSFLFWSKTIRGGTLSDPLWSLPGQTGSVPCSRP